MTQCNNLQHKRLFATFSIASLSYYAGCHISYSYAERLRAKGTAQSPEKTPLYAAKKFYKIGP
jgi:hypothetical protein